jgi:hypothetical protein
MMLGADLSLFLGTSSATEKGFSLCLFDNPPDISDAAPAKHLHHAPGSDLRA